MGRTKKTDAAKKDARLSLRTRREFREWAVALAKADGTEITALVVRLLVAYGKRKKFSPPPDAGETYKPKAPPAKPAAPKPKPKPSTKRAPKAKGS